MMAGKQFRGMLAFLLTLGILLGGLPAAAWAEEPGETQEQVEYAGAPGGGVTGGTCTGYTLLTGEHTAWKSGWYVADGNISIAERVTVSGDVHLILKDNCTLTAGKGILVQGQENSLTIWGQSGGTGTLTAATTEDSNAGIGGEYNSWGGTITINGGTVNARSKDGAGIGSGGFVSNDVKVTININGGTVTASSQNGAGIGGGMSSQGNVDVTVKGGTVTASSQAGGAGIGGSNGGAVTISGDSRVTATGGAGIGGGASMALIIGTGNVFVDASSIRAELTVESGASAILFNGQSGTVYGNAALLAGETLDIPAGKTLHIPGGASLMVPDGAKLIVRDGAALANEGTVEIVNSSSFIKEPGASITGITEEGRLSYAVPAAAIDYINETLKDLAANGRYCIEVDGASSRTVTAQDNGTIPLVLPDWLGKTLSITRVCPDGADTQIPDSEPQSLSIRPRPDAPQNLEVYGPAYKGEPGYIFVDPDTAYQYKPADSDEWMPLMRIPLPAGTYLVRLAPTANDFASEAATVEIPEGTKENPCRIELSGDGLELMPSPPDTPFYVWDCGEAEDGYTDIPEQTVTITNAGEIGAEVRIELEENEDTFNIQWGKEFSQDTSPVTVNLAPGETATFSVQPKQGLNVREYSSDLMMTVFSGELESKKRITIRARFQVLPAAPVFTPGPAMFHGESTDVTITCSTEGADIYYTTDGSEPKLEENGQGLQPADGSTQKYDREITLTDTTTIKAVSVKNNQLSSSSTATYTKVHMIQFNSNGGSAMEALTVENGKTAEKPADPTKDGYTFDGWYTDEACKTPWDFNSPVTGDITLYAKWTEKPAPVSVTVTFNSNGGTAVEALTVESGAKATAPTDPTREGHTFGGWFTDTACTAAWSFESPVTENITLYAKWTQNTVKTPVLNPIPADGETFDERITVSITCATDGAEIYYTTDGTIPTASSAKYTDSLVLTETAIVQAVAVKTGWKDSGIAQAAYTKKDAPGPDGHEHSYDAGEITKAPTCTGPGELTKTCTLCGHQKAEPVPALGHDFDEGTVTREPAADAEGERTFTCKRCGATRIESIPALGQHTHTFDAGTVTREPTCTEAGVKTKTCTVCGGTQTESIPALGHAYDEGTVTREPTADAEGVRTFTCTRCGAGYTESIPRLSGGTSEPAPTPPASTPEQPERDNWQEQLSTAPEAGSGSAWKYVDDNGVTATTPRLLPARDGTPRLYLFDGNGLLQTGAVPASVAANGTEIRISPEGDVAMNGCLYYLNPERVLNDPRSCYAERDYMRTLSGGAGSRFYDKNGITFEGWLRGSDGKMRYQTVIRTADSGRYLLVVWRVQTLPACQDPDHPGDPAYMIPAGRYFFDDFGVLVTEAGWHDGRDGKEYYTNARGQVLDERPRA